MVRAGVRLGIAEVCRRAMRFCSDRRGIAAIEFAFIVPVLLIMYFVTMEASQAVETNKKVSRISSMVADLITQQQGVSSDVLDDIMKIGTSTLQPYNRSTPTIIVTAITITNDTTPKVLVAWSRKVVGGVYSADAKKDTTTTVPSALKVKGTFLIRVETDLAYEPIITWSADSGNRLGLTSAFNSIPMGETYYLRPRRSPEVACTSC